MSEIWERVKKINILNYRLSDLWGTYTTKEGRFKGVNTHAHEVDVIIEVGKGEAKATGRLAAGGKVTMLDEY